MEVKFGPLAIPSPKTVKELKEALAGLPDDLPICVVSQGYYSVHKNDFWLAIVPKLVRVKTEVFSERDQPVLQF